MQYGLTPTALFDATGAVLQPSEVLYGKPVLVQPGRFRPPTLVSAEIQANALECFRAEAHVGDAPVVSLLGMTLDQLTVEGGIDVRDYLDRIDVLAGGRFTIMVSTNLEHFRLAEYVSRYTSEPIGIAMGVPNLVELFDEHSYEDLDGGALEALGRLFKHQVKLFIYPMLDRDSADLITAHDFKLSSKLDILYRYLLEEGRIEAIETFDREHVAIRSKDVRHKLRIGDTSWEDTAPSRIAQLIKGKKLSGYEPASS